MKENLVAAIMGAVNTYIQQEEQARAMPRRAALAPETSPWQIFGRQELMRARTNLHARRASR